MPRIKTAPSASIPARRPTHYHLLLRPVLQRSFARACSWCFVVCYIVSFLLGPPKRSSPSSLWRSLTNARQSRRFWFHGHQHFSAPLCFLCQSFLFWSSEKQNYMVRSECYISHASPTPTTLHTSLGRLHGITFYQYYPFWICPYYFRDMLDVFVLENCGRLDYNYHEVRQFASRLTEGATSCRGSMKSWFISCSSLFMYRPSTLLSTGSLIGHIYPMTRYRYHRSLRPINSSSQVWRKRFFSKPTNASSLHA
jgi:hypothetical protein